jgi:hypothetical protein
VAQARATRLHVLVTREGNPAELARAGLPYTQLPALGGSRMIRVSEMVLPGHPDKFCDQVADAIVAECVRIDPDAYAQVEIAAGAADVADRAASAPAAPGEEPAARHRRRDGLAIGYVAGQPHRRQPLHGAQRRVQVWRPGALHRRRSTTRAW